MKMKWVLMGPSKEDWERLGEFSKHEVWLCYYGKNGQCPCKWPHCDNKDK